MKVLDLHEPFLIKRGDKIQIARLNISNYKTGIDIIESYQIEVKKK